MGKIKIGFVGVYLILIAVCGFSQNTLRDSVASTYLSEIGIREATGHNDGDRVELYLASCGRKAGDAWCAAFVNWCLEVNNASRAESGWSPSWHPKSKLIYRPSAGINKATPQPGDVFGIWFTKLKRIAHTGFIHAWGPEVTITVEGNTNEAGSREGDGVYRKRRLTRQIHSVSNWIDK
jgi:hypothetical protein